MKNIYHKNMVIELTQDEYLRLSEKPNIWVLKKTWETSNFNSWDTIKAKFNWKLLQCVVGEWIKFCREERQTLKNYIKVIESKARMKVSILLGINGYVSDQEVERQFIEVFWSTNNDEYLVQYFEITKINEEWDMNCQ